MNQSIDHTQLAGQIVEKFSGIFPSMSSWDQTKANKYRDAMADALRVNKNIGHPELMVGIENILKGNYKGDWPPAVNTFVEMCKANISTVKYLPQATRVKRTEQEIKESKEKGNKALAVIKDMMKND